MARGFLGGILFGGVVSVIAAVAITAVIGPPVPPQPETASVEVTPGSEFQERREDREAAVPAPLPQPEPGAPPVVAAPEPDTLAPMQGADTDPAAQPQTGAPEDTLSTPPAQGQRGRVEVVTDAPVLPSAQAALPVAPTAEDSVDTPASPAAPEPAADPVQQTGQEKTPQEAPQETAGQSGADTDAAPVVEDTAPAMQPPAQEVPAQDQIAATDPSEPAAPAPAPAATPAPEPAPASTPAPEPAPSADAAPDTAETTEPAPEEDATDRPSVGTPATTLFERADSRVSSRLPSVAADQQDDAGDQAEEAEAAEIPADAPPIIAHAAAFQNPEGKPLMSIVLIDRGDFSSAVEALSTFPYPVSFAIDPLQDGAAEAAARYRAAGFEVLALVDIPEAAQATDVEVNLAAALTALPDVVAVMEGDGSGLQSSRAISDQAAAYLRDSGHGLVMYPKGLDTARKLAEKEGVPAVTLFRDFDANGQDANVIRRFLDQAAFKAAQEPASVVMVGRARPETVSALILWGLADRAGRVALAPVSALLRARAGMEADLSRAE